MSCLGGEPSKHPSAHTPPAESALHPNWLQVAAVAQAAAAADLAEVAADQAAAAADLVEVAADLAAQAGLAAQVCWG